MTALDLFANAAPLAIDQRWALITGDSLTELALLQSNSIDALVTDPLDEQAGPLQSGSMAAGTYASRKGRVYSGDAGRPLAVSIVGSKGGASRFFYVAKPTRAERDRGCDALPGGARNFHPTVKPQGLMRWLVRLITPPGGIVLDPFTGSGSTGVAALAEGHRFLGIEREAEYSTIATARIEHAAKGET